MILSLAWKSSQDFRIVSSPYLVVFCVGKGLILRVKEALFDPWFCKPLRPNLVLLCGQRFDPKSNGSLV